MLFDPAASLPRSVNVLVELPPVPAQGPFLVGPVLGRRGPGRHVVRAGLDASGDRPGEFEPLLVPRMTRPEDLVAVTRVCSFDHAEAAPPRRVVRTLRSAAGVVLQGLHPVAVMLAKQQAAWCGDVTDVIPATALRHGEAYVFEARFSDDPDRPPGTARFSVGPAPR